MKNKTSLITLMNILEDLKKYDDSTYYINLIIIEIASRLFDGIDENKKQEFLEEMLVKDENGKVKRFQ